MKLQVIDSHTGGEPTRVVLPGQIELSSSTMVDRRDEFDAKFDGLRRGLILEPRGSDVWVGALLTAPVSSCAQAGVIFFNAAGMLGMCGHGTIGVVETLRHLGQLSSGEVKLETPVGPVTAKLLDDENVQLINVKSYCYLPFVNIDVEGFGPVEGSVCYGGNWFFIVREKHFEISIANASELDRLCWAIRAALVKDGITGEGGAEIDHVELEGAPVSKQAQSRNYVQCPGGAYDRSPCGTGTSAKLSMLAHFGQLKPGEKYVQESVTGSCFVASYASVDGGIIPTLIGRAHVTAEATLFFSDEDPLKEGIIDA